MSFTYTKKIYYESKGWNLIEPSSNLYQMTSALLHIHCSDTFKSSSFYQEPVADQKRAYIVCVYFFFNLHCKLINKKRFRWLFLILRTIYATIRSLLRYYSVALTCNVLLIMSNVILPRSWSVCGKNETQTVKFGKQLSSMQTFALNMHGIFFTRR